MTSRLRWTLAILAVATFAVAGTARASDRAVEGSFERTLKVTGPVDLDVTTGSGQITLRAGEAGSVRVRGTIRAHSGSRDSDKSPEEKVRYLESNPPIEQNGNSIHIGHITDEELRRNVAISYELVVPAETQLHSETGSGSQTIDAIRGPVEASTGSGSLRISNIGTEVRATTGSGSIELNDVKASVRASTGSGSIRATGIAGGLVASTGSGGVRLEQTAAGNVEIETGSGSVEAKGVRGALRVRTGSGSITAQGEATAEWHLHTGSGSVTVQLPGEAAFDLYARTSSGHIQTAHPITVQGIVSPRELRGKVRGGGVLLDLSTSSGNIQID